MTAELDDMRASLIAAVQAELDRYGVTMILVGLIGFNVFSKIKPRPQGQ